MSLDDASYPVLWTIASETGVLPEYLLPVLWLESNFTPSVQNRSGAAFYGINQASTALIRQYAGTDPQTYMTWPASQQLNTVVRRFMGSLVKSHGPLRSATRCYQANFLPGTLNTARQLSDVITSSPSAFYNANTGLDFNHDGKITVSDIAAKMRQVAATAQVKTAIQGAYAVKDASTLGAPDPTNVDHIVYGDDFSFANVYQPWIIGGAIFLGAAAASYYIWSQPHSRRRRRGRR